MKVLIKIFILILLVNKSFAQEIKLITGANVSLFQPIGTLASRFKPTIGGSVFFGQDVNPKWSWYGKLEYGKFSKENEEKLFVAKKVTVNNVEKSYDFPLQKLSMELDIAAFSVNANYNLFRNEFFETNLNFGFGVCRWTYKRNSYYDSLIFVDNNERINGGYIDVPQMTQQDWSGTFNFGVDLNLQVIEPVWFNLAANYKAVVGEIWATLKLGQENISTMQMFDYRAGLKLKF